MGKFLRMEKANWLRDFLERSVSSLQLEINPSRLSEESIDNEIENGEENGEKFDQEIEKQKFSNEVRAIMATYTALAEPRLKNSGFNAKTANITSRACIIS